MILFSRNWENRVQLTELCAGIKAIRDDVIICVDPDLRITSWNAAAERLHTRTAADVIGTAIMQSRGLKVHAAGCLAVDRWQGEERVQLRLTDIAPADLPI